MVDFIHAIALPFAPLAEQEVVRHFSWAPAVSPWIVIPGVILVGVLIYYLYAAQRQIASRRIVAWLTGLRLALIALLAILLLRPLWVWHRTQQRGETLWVVLDQSLSTGQKDSQALPIERLRWADALRLLPPDVRASKLDRCQARLGALHDELLHLQRQNYAAGDQKQAARQHEEFVDALKIWNEHLNDLIAHVSSDPGAGGPEAAGIVRSLRESAGAMAGAIAQSAALTQTQSAAEVPWGKVGGQLDAALASLKNLADVSDNRFLAAHASDQQVNDALAKVAQMRRADIAYAALTGKSRDLPKSMSDVFDRQNTKVLTFASGEQIIATGSKSEIPKAIQAGVQPVGSSTNIAGALRFIADQIPQGERASVLLVSDGRINDGGDPADAAQKLAARGARIFTLKLGHTRQVAIDASVDYVDAPDWIFKDDTLRASALLRLDGLDHQPVTVEFLRGSSVIDTQTVTPTGNQATKLVTFRDKPPGADVYEYTVRIPVLPKEAVKENNSQTFRVSVKNDKLHVLVIEDQPRYDTRYLVNYLRRDRRVQVQYVLMEPIVLPDVKAPDPIKASPTNPSEIAQLLPTTAEEWSAFDLIVLGDVPTENLSAEAQNNIAKAVRDRGTALMVIAGHLNMPERYTGTPLAELLPVHLSSNWSAAAMADQIKNGWQPAMAPEGAASILSQLGIDDQTNGQYWAGMPKWFWHSEQTQAKQSASVIWQIPDPHPDATRKSDDTLTAARGRALLATMPVGMGRVMYLASDQIWRMRQVEGVNLEDRFWGQVIRWTVQSDMPAGGKFVRFGTGKPRYTAGDSVVVSARVLKEDFTPMLGQKFRIVARSTRKDPLTGKLTPGPVVASAAAVEAPESPGIYRATLSGINPGAVEISLQGQAVEKLLNDDPTATQKTLMVDVLSGTDREMRNVNADPAAMERIAQAGDGISTDVAYTDVLAQHIPNLERPQESIEQIGLFNDPQDPNTKKAHYGFLILFVTLITAEWILRKVGGLV